MQELPRRLEEDRYHYPPPRIQIERISVENLQRTAKAMREAWPELGDNTS
ncbi:hypothetical protein ACFWPH_00075 [Nocardia sp. NPDC058499]